MSARRTKVTHYRITLLKQLITGFWHMGIPYFLFQFAALFLNTERLCGVITWLIRGVRWPPVGVLCTLSWGTCVCSVYPLAKSHKVCKCCSQRVLIWKMTLLGSNNSVWWISVNSSQLLQKYLSSIPNTAYTWGKKLHVSDSYGLLNHWKSCGHL